jgi:hypothetical protein
MTTSCEIKQQNAFDDFLGQNVTGDPYINSPFYDKIEPLFKKYQQSVSGDSNRELDNQLLVSNTAKINEFFANEITSNTNFGTLYPNLVERINTTTFITPAEVQTVIDTSFLTLDTAGDYVIPYNPTLPTLFNDYYSPGQFSGSGMKSFCDLVPNIFAAYTDLMNAFNDIKAFAGKITSILSAIQDFSLAGLIESLKQQALQVVDQIVGKIKAKIAQITGLFTRISNFRFNTDNVYSKMNAEKQKIDELVSDPSIDNLKGAIEGAIAFASSLFEALNIEEIQFIILRFCELISGIENFFDDLIRPIQELPDSFRSSFNFLQAANYSAAARASHAGAFRLPSEQRAAAAQQLQTMPATIVGGDGALFGDEGFVVPGGIAVRRRTYKINPITPEEMDILLNQLTFEQVKAGTTYIKLRTDTNSFNGFPEPKSRIWTYVRDVEKIMLYRLGKKINSQIAINSAFRTTGADASWHKSGQAFDITISSVGMDMNAFTQYARSEGFGAVQPYYSEGFVHIDTGPIRSWKT